MNVMVGNGKNHLKKKITSKLNIFLLCYYDL